MQGGGGWIQLDESAGKVLVSSTFKRPEMQMNESLRGSSEVKKTDMEMQKEQKQQAKWEEVKDSNTEINNELIDSDSGPCEAQGETNQGQVSFKESSLQELITKWEPMVATFDSAEQRMLKDETQQTIDDEELNEPNMKFVNAFDSFSSFIKAAGFIEDWIRTKKNNPTDFSNDFPAVLKRGLLIRKILIHLRKGVQPTKDKNGAILEPEVKYVHQLIFTKELYPTEDDYIFYFTINLLEACSIRYNVPVLIIRIALNHLGFMI